MEACPSKSYIFALNCKEKFFDHLSVFHEFYVSIKKNNGVFFKELNKAHVITVATPNSRILKNFFS